MAKQSAKAGSSNKRGRLTVDKLPSATRSVGARNLKKVRGGTTNQPYAGSVTQKGREK